MQEAQKVEQILRTEHGIGVHLEVVRLARKASEERTEQQLGLLPAAYYQPSIWDPRASYLKLGERRMWLCPRGRRKGEGAVQLVRVRVELAARRGRAVWTQRQAIG